NEPARSAAVPRVGDKLLLESSGRPNRVCEERKRGGDFPHAAPRRQRNEGLEAVAADCRLAAARAGASLHAGAQPYDTVSVWSFHEQESHPTNSPARYQPHRPTIHPDARLVRAGRLLQAPGRQLRTAAPQVLRRRGPWRQAPGAARGAGVLGDRAGRAPQGKGAQGASRRLATPDASVPSLGPTRPSKLCGETPAATQAIMRK